MDNCIGTTYVQIIENTECIGNSLTKINYNFAALDREVCALNTLAEPWNSINGIVKIQDGVFAQAEQGTDYFRPGDELNASLKINGSLQSSGEFTVNGTSHLIGSTVIGESAADAHHIKGKLTIQGSTNNIQLIENQINAGPLTQADDTLRINYTGYNEDIQYFRSLNIYNGKKTSLMYINASTSKVGIGTTSPAATLHIVGDLKVEGSIINDSPLSSDITVNLSNISSEGALENQVITYKNDIVCWDTIDFPVQESVSGSGFVIFDTPGTVSWTVPSGIKRVTIEMYGAGGGGSASRYIEAFGGRAYQYNGPIYYNDIEGLVIPTWVFDPCQPNIPAGWLNTCGGGGGGHAVFTKNVVSGQNINITVGAGGTGGQINNSWVNRAVQMGYQEASFFSESTNYKGSNGGSTTVIFASDGVSVVANGGEGGGTYKDLNPNIATNYGGTFKRPFGGSGGSVPLVNAGGTLLVGEGAGGTYTGAIAQRGTGSNGGYGGAAGGFAGGASGIHSCGGTGGSIGNRSDLGGTVSNSMASFASNTYQSSVDKAWRDGVGYGGGGHGGRPFCHPIARKTDISTPSTGVRNWNGIVGQPVQMNVSVVPNSYILAFDIFASDAENVGLGRIISWDRNGNWHFKSLMHRDVFSGGNGSNGAVIIRY